MDVQRIPHEKLRQVVSPPLLFFNVSDLLTLDIYPFTPKGSKTRRVAILMLLWRRAEYLKVSLDLLKQVEGIEDVTLIVSYDGLFPEVSALIDQVDFCRVST